MRNKKAQIEINPASEDGYRWIENIGTAWRLVGFADDINTSMTHRGWFTEEDFQDEVFRGVVYQLPNHKGKPVYFVGYADPNNSDCARGEIRTDLDDKEDAARAADRIAEVCAENEREYHSAWRLGQNYADTFEVVETQRAERKALLADIRKIKDADTPAICGVLRAKIKSTHRNIMAALQERRDILNDSYVSRRLIDAFADGAGISIEDANLLF